MDTERLRMDVEAIIRSIPDFPKPGILFRDITTVLRNGPLFQRVVAHLGALVQDARCDCVAGVESRGFVFAAPVAANLGLPLALIRKPGKLPWRVRRESYALEYGTDAIEMHEDAVHPGERVALVDDLLATGGTAEAAVRLIRALGADVELCAFLVELKDLAGRDRLASIRVEALVGY